MIKNFNETISLISLTILVFLTIKFGFGLIFSSNQTGNARDNYDLLNKYSENEEE